MMIIRRAAFILPLALALAACGGDAQPAGVIAREKFVAANVAVRSLPDGATKEERAAVLRKHGVTEKQLQAWVTGHARQPETLAKAWEEIAFKLDSAGPGGLVATPRPSPTSPGGVVPPPRPAGMADSVIIAPPPPPPPPAAVGEERGQAPRRKRVQQVQ